MSTLFRLSNFLVLPFWTLMILLPRWRWTVRILRSPFVSVAPALLYAALVLPRLGSIWPVVAKPTVSGVALLLSSPEGATIAWVHFLAFDLFVGRWIYLDIQERGFSVLLSSPILFLTLLLGPLGFLIYLVVRAFALPASEREAGSSVGAAGSEPSTAVQAEAKALLLGAWKTSRPLTVLGAVMIVTFVATVAGVLFDHRVITGAPAWLKPAKFAISVSVYCFTFVWMLGFVRVRPRIARTIANVTVLSLVVEMAAILTQAARGTTSHFNMSTPLDSLLWLTMGAFIVVVWLMNLLLAILLLFERVKDCAFAWSLRIGLVISLAGMAVAFFMVRPTPSQSADLAASHKPKIVGAHSVGVPDGGPGLPITGWSTAGGDLRVAHFVGLHALQVLPLLGWLLTRRRGFLDRLRDTHRLALVWTAGLTYLGLVLLLTWQALRGQSVVHPDARTLTVGGALVFFAGVSTVTVMLRARRASQSVAFHFDLSRT